MTVTISVLLFSASFLAELSVRSPWKLFIFIIWKNIFWIKVSQNKIIKFWKRKHCSYCSDILHTVTNTDVSNECWIPRRQVKNHSHKSIHAYNCVHSWPVLCCVCVSVKFNASFLAEISVTSPRKHLFSLSKTYILHQSIQKNTWFNFEKRSTGEVLLLWLGMVRSMGEPNFKRLLNLIYVCTVSVYVTSKCSMCCLICFWSSLVCFVFKQLFCLLAAFVKGRKAENVVKHLQSHQCCRFSRIIAKVTPRNMYFYYQNNYL